MEKGTERYKGYRNGWMVLELELQTVMFVILMHIYVGVYVCVCVCVLIDVRFCRISMKR